MPLDALYRTPLPTVAQRLGITPIPLDRLERHKAAELAKHPGSWWYHHPGATDVALVLLILALVIVSAVATAAAIDVSAGFAIFDVPLLAAVVAVWRIGGVRVQAPAYWAEEVWVPDNQPAAERGIPPEIAAMASDILQGLPGSYATIGTLYQHSVVLDPYLVIRAADVVDCIVLGIWDEHRVILQAQR